MPPLPANAGSWYDQYNVHIGQMEHERFFDEICHFRKRFVKGKTPVIIWDWYARRILLLDKRYEPFLKARGCR